MFIYDKKYRFTEQWFDPMIPIWEGVFEDYKHLYGEDKIKSVLEIGCFEGRATVFLCNQILNPGTNYDIVDTFGGTLVEQGMRHTSKRLDENENYLYDTFTHNISFHSDINFNIHRGYSQHVLPTLVEQNKKYDFIYIDASHRSDDTYVDAYFAHKMLNPDGIIIFDDFSWKDPNSTHPVDSPELGIRMFLTLYSDLYEVFLNGYQIGIKRK
jgi:SAM-dependent methyltransferase